MTNPAFSKILLTFVAAFALACVPDPAFAQRGGGHHRSGGSHGGSSHRGGSFHGGGHSSFRGGGHAHGRSRSGARVSSSHFGGNHLSNKRMSGGSSAKPRGISSRSSGNLARNSDFGSGSFSSSGASRNFGRSGTSRPAARVSRSNVGDWHSFGNSTGRSMPASARTFGNAMGGGWNSFDNLSRIDRAEMSRGYGGYARTDARWHSFGNSRNAFLGTDVSGFSSFGASRAMASDTHASRLGFGSNRFLTNMPGSSRFSSFSSFSSSPSIMNFGSSDFGSSDFGNSGLGRSDFSNSLIGSNVSLIPSLLLGGLLRLGTSVFGGEGLLGASALTFAARSFVSGLASNGFGRGGFAGGDFGFGRGGFGGGFGFDEAPVWPASVGGAGFWRPGWVCSGYCGPYPSYPLGWSGIGYFSGPR